jgi:sulfur-oxidizing protein SoxX
VNRPLAWCLLAASSAATAADALDTPLAPVGDVTRGRGVFVSREGGHCVICHVIAGIAPAGDVGPPLDGIARRLTPGQIRLRIVDITRVKPDAAMPSFYRTEGLERVASAYIGTPLLDRQQIEDLVAYLETLR